MSQPDDITLIIIDVLQSGRSTGGWGGEEAIGPHFSYAAIGGGVESVQASLRIDDAVQVARLASMLPALGVMRASLLCRPQIPVQPVERFLDLFISGNSVARLVDDAALGLFGGSSGRNIDAREVAPGNGKVARSAVAAPLTQASTANPRQALSASREAMATVAPSAARI